MTEKTPQTSIEWIKSIDNKVSQLDHKMDRYLNSVETKTEANRAYDRLQRQINTKASKEDVDKLQRNQRWVVRLIIGAVLVAVLALVISTQTPDDVTGKLKETVSRP